LVEVISPNLFLCHKRNTFVFVVLPLLYPPQDILFPKKLAHIGKKVYICSGIILEEGKPFNIYRLC